MAESLKTPFFMSKTEAELRQVFLEQVKQIPAGKGSKGAFNAGLARGLVRLVMRWIFRRAN